MPSKSGVGSSFGYWTPGYVWLTVSRRFTSSPKVNPSSSSDAAVNKRGCFSWRFAAPGICPGEFWGPLVAFAA
jgi:hypothetical protein